MMALPKIPGYELLTCLGGGAVTTVYSARACDTDFPCAIKVLRPVWEDQPVAVKLLQREARAALSVSHPHLVRVLEAHVLTPPYYLVLEHRAGESLRRRLRREYRLDVPTAIWIVRQIAEALAALHHRGFIHGDVKPENIRLTHTGQALLLDLGFAHRRGENASFLEQGYVLGTANYLAPELCGDAPNDDERADIFSLGATLFEMLAGQLPYPEGLPRETMQVHCDEQPMLLTDVEPMSSPALTELVDRMMSLDATDRPSAEQLVQELVGYEIASFRRRQAA